MNQDTKPAPFNLGDHIRYVAKQKYALPVGRVNETRPILAPGMEGVVLISTGDLSDQGAAAPNPWHCKAQFQNGFQIDITPENCGDFEVARGARSPTV